MLSFLVQTIFTNALWLAVDDFIFVVFDFFGVTNAMAPVFDSIHFTIGILVATSGFWADIVIGFGHSHGLTAEQCTK